MYYVAKTYPQAKFIMLVTCKEYNPTNYSNYMHVGMPVPCQGGGYTLIPMIDMDTPGHIDEAFDKRVGNDDACELWTHGEW